MSYMLKTSDPTEWTAQRRWTLVLTTCLISFLAGIDATSITSALPEIAARFHVDDSKFQHSYFTVTAWSTGAAIVPLFILPIMEDFGIRKFYLTIYLLFMIFVMAAGVAPNFGALVTFRAFAGSFGGVLQNIVDAVAADVWKGDIGRRTESLTAYTFALVGGVTFGPVFGGVIIHYLYWRWIFYIELIIYGALLPYLLLVISDTRPKGEKSLREVREVFSTTVLRSVRLLGTEFIISTFTLWSSFCFGTVFLFTQSVAQVYGSMYGWDGYQTGVVQIAVVIGELLGYGACLVQNRYLYQMSAKHNKEGSSSPVHEGRLYLSIFGSLVGLSGGYFVYAWTSYPSVPWVGPTIGLGLVGFGVMTVVQAVVCYVTDAYASHAASAVAGNAFGENIFAAFLPLATLQIYSPDTGMGFHWASSFLGFLGLLLSCVPVVLVFAGPSIRRRSPFMD
ncbi:hypothetical protein PMZ80_008868 [Knufia obscura]|uniref:Major facilitator superfamily (MFS) profile domain-containing protein n=1 Tax=Knufia obscura TaxID=1635080 RepID=A0ABR0REM6_9EURO|nr:hypothetical protein PMZ80_008868 [Knufia obscura]